MQGLSEEQTDSQLSPSSDIKSNTKGSKVRVEKDGTPSKFGMPPLPSSSNGGIENPLQSSRDIDTLISQANECLRECNYQKAIEYLNEAIQLNKNKDIYVRLAETYIKLANNEFSKMQQLELIKLAISNYREVNKIDSEDDRILEVMFSLKERAKSLEQQLGQEMDGRLSREKRVYFPEDKKYEPLVQCIDEFKKVATSGLNEQYVKNWIIVRVWSAQGKNDVQYSDRQIMINLMRGRDQVGHASIQTENFYISLWPKKTPSPTQVLLREGVEAELHDHEMDVELEGRVADFCTILHTIPADVINKIYKDKIEPQVKAQSILYELTGRTKTPGKKQQQNCSAIVMELLCLGLNSSPLCEREIYDSSEIYTPNDIAKLAWDLKYKEIQYFRRKGLSNDAIDAIDILKHHYFHRRELIEEDAKDKKISKLIDKTNVLKLSHIDSIYYEIDIFLMYDLSSRTFSSLRDVYIFTQNPSGLIYINRKGFSEKLVIRDEKEFTRLTFGICGEETDPLPKRNISEEQLQKFRAIIASNEGHTVLRLKDGSHFEPSLSIFSKPKDSLSEFDLRLPPVEDSKDDEHFDPHTVTVHSGPGLLASPKPKIKDPSPSKEEKNTSKGKCIIL